MTLAQRRLHTAAGQAGLGGVLAELANATHAGLTYTDDLDDQTCDALRLAVEICAQAGLTAVLLHDSIRRHRRRFGNRWRGPFGQSQLRVASIRYSRPGVFGRSPCEDADADLQARRTAAVHALPPSEIHPAVASAPALVGLLAA